MYKSIFLFLITLFSKFYITKQIFEEMNLPLNSTSEFKGFTIRKINETSIYISNYFQEVFFDFKTIPKPDDEFKRENLEEGTFMGSLYPQIKLLKIDNKIIPEYYISKSQNNSFWIRYYDFESNNSSDFKLSGTNQFLPISISMNEKNGDIFGVVRYYYKTSNCAVRKNPFCGEYACNTY